MFFLLSKTLGILLLPTNLLLGVGLVAALLLATRLASLGRKLLIAKRVEIKPIFERFPQQSDYSTAWEGENEDRGDHDATPGLIERIPGAVSRRLKKLTQPDAIRYETGDLVRFDPFG